MTTKILCVDDEPEVLAGYERQLRKQFELATAVGGEQGLRVLEERGPFAVIVTDMRMSGMSGLEFLRHVRERSPGSVRIMLTGNNDQQTVRSAVNEGNVFRFLTKPCPADTLALALRAGLEHFRLASLEKDLLEQTLHGSVTVLTELLSLVNPVAFGHAVRVKRLVCKVAEALKAPDLWQFDMAALLAPIGCVTVPEAILDKVNAGATLSAEEQTIFERHPHIAGDLVRRIPRLEAVADMIAYQEKRFDGHGPPAEARRGSDIPLGARLLKVTTDYERLQARGLAPVKIFESLRSRFGWYDPELLGALETVVYTAKTHERKLVALGDMRPGMILDDNIVNAHGMLMVGKGHEITETLLHRLQNIVSHHKIAEPIGVLTPIEEPDETTRGTCRRPGDARPSPLTMFDRLGA